MEKKFCRTKSPAANKWIHSALVGKETVGKKQAGAKPGGKSQHLFYAEGRLGQKEGDPPKEEQF